LFEILDLKISRIKKEHRKSFWKLFRLKILIVSINIVIPISRIFLVVFFGIFIQVILGSIAENDLTKENELAKPFASLISSIPLVFDVLAFSSLIISLFYLIVRNFLKRKQTDKTDMLTGETLSRRVTKFLVEFASSPSVYFIAIVLPKIIIFAILLIIALLSRKFDPEVLLFDAVILWGFNLLTFATIYWLADDGGVDSRNSEDHAYNSVFFVFPEIEKKGVNWKPHFIDYLFLAFNLSTAFSITDTNVIAKRIKILVMIQTLISLITFAVFIARAINILGG